jgi:peptidoglycan/LPS O-acetylase OafA/YrhL
MPEAATEAPTEAVRREVEGRTAESSGVAPAAGGHRSDNIRFLTGIRAVAALWVLLFHIFMFATPLYGGDSWFAVLSAAGYMGVDFFFVLSGFILAYQYSDSLAHPSRTLAARFLALRLARIYPLHIATMVLVALIVGVGGVFGMRPGNPDQLSPRLGLANLLLVHAWGWGAQRSWNEPSWSISCEWFAYLCFPWLALGLARVRRHTTAWFLCLGPIVVMWAVLGVVNHGEVGDPLRFGLIRICGEFLSGYGAFLVWRLSGAARLPSWTAMALLLAMAVLVGTRLSDPFVAAVFPVLILALLANSQSRLARLLSSPFVVLLGELSYSIYMLNQRLILVANRVYPFARLEHRALPIRAAAGGLLAAGIVGASLLTYKWLEEPARHRARQLIDRWWPVVRAPRAQVAGEARAVRRRPNSESRPRST